MFECVYTVYNYVSVFVARLMIVFGFRLVLTFFVDCTCYCLHHMRVCYISYTRGRSKPRNTVQHFI